MVETKVGLRGLVFEQFEGLICYVEIHYDPFIPLTSGSKRSLLLRMMLTLSPTNPKPEEEVMADKQYKQLGCLDVQPSGGCGFQVRAETEAELMQLVATHAKQCHKLDSIPPEMAAQVKAAIKTVPVTV